MVIPPEFDTFGARLLWWIKARGKSQAEVAEHLGMGKSTLSEICAGDSKRPNAENFVKLCNLLDLHPDYLMWGKGSPESISFSKLTGDEAQLVMLFRSLPDDAKRHALMIDVNDTVNRSKGKIDSARAIPEPTKPLVAQPVTPNKKSTRKNSVKA